MLLSMKHCVAIGGATWGCGDTKAEPLPISTDAAAGGICNDYTKLVSALITLSYFKYEYQLRNLNCFKFNQE